MCCSGRTLLAYFEVFRGFTQSVHTNVICLSASWPFPMTPFCSKCTYPLSHHTTAHNFCNLWKAKVVPLHAMEALGGRGNIAPTHSWPRHYAAVSSQSHAPTALNLGERTHGTHCTGGWVGPKADLDREAKGKRHSLLPGIEPRSPGRPVRSQTLYSLSYPGSSANHTLSLNTLR
jgi:hypothetical protein